VTRTAGGKVGNATIRGRFNAYRAREGGKGKGKEGRGALKFIDNAKSYERKKGRGRKGNK